MVQEEHHIASDSVMFRLLSGPGVQCVAELKQMNKNHLSQTDLALNLRYLSGFYRSIADVCRRVDVNRSQFNKYISGLAQPSPFIMRRLSDFFGLEEYELRMPHAQVVALMAKGPNGRRNNTETFLPTEIVGDIRKAQVHLGIYRCYKMSMRSPRHVIVSLMNIYKFKGRICVSYIEKSGKRKHRYRGTLSYLGERIFITCRDTLFSSEITSFVLFPSSSRTVQTLSGLCLGAASDNSRVPTCVRIVLQPLPGGTNLRKELWECTNLKKDNPRIPDDILRLLTENETDTGVLKAIST